MKRFVMVLVLTCALSGVALAGEMPISGIAPPSTDTGTYQYINEDPTDNVTAGLNLSLLLTLLDLAF